MKKYLSLVWFLFEILLLVAVYSIGTLVFHGWIVLFWAGRILVGIATEL